MLGSVQIRGTKLVDGMKTMSYQERLQALDLPTLLHRRDRGDMIQVAMAQSFGEIMRQNREATAAASENAHELIMEPQAEVA